MLVACCDCSLFFLSFCRLFRLARLTVLECWIDFSKFWWDHLSNLGVWNIVSFGAGWFSCFFTWLSSAPFVLYWRLVKLLLAKAGIGSLLAGVQASGNFWEVFPFM